MSRLGFLLTVVATNGQKPTRETSRHIDSPAAETRQYKYLPVPMLISIPPYSRFQIRSLVLLQATTSPAPKFTQAHQDASLRKSNGSCSHDDDACQCCSNSRYVPFPWNCTHDIDMAQDPTVLSRLRSVKLNRFTLSILW